MSRRDRNELTSRSRMWLAWPLSIVLAALVSGCLDVPAFEETCEPNEICDGIDNDCDGDVDEDCNKDGDDYCAAGLPVVVGPDGNPPAVCPLGEGDCDDENADVYPGANEVCDDADNNCADGVDEGCNPDGDAWCATGADVVGSPSICPAGAGDCDETSVDVHPDADEVCDDVDNNCDDVTDEGCDEDGDGVCAEGATVVGMPAVCSEGTGDCDDTSDAVYPGAPEQCDEIDNDCNDMIDDGVQETWWADADGDNFGDPDTSQDTCLQPMDFVANDLDCDDTDPAINPDAEEVCGGPDMNCDQQAPTLTLGTPQVIRPGDPDVLSLDVAQAATDFGLAAVRHGDTGREAVFALMRDSGALVANSEVLLSDSAESVAAAAIAFGNDVYAVAWSAASPATDDVRLFVAAYDTSGVLTDGPHDVGAANPDDALRVVAHDNGFAVFHSVESGGQPSTRAIDYTVGMTSFGMSDLITGRRVADASIAREPGTNRIHLVWDDFDPGMSPAEAFEHVSWRSTFVSAPARRSYPAGTSPGRPLLHALGNTLFITWLADNTSSSQTDDRELYVAPFESSGTVGTPETLLATDALDAPVAGTMMGGNEHVLYQAVDMSGNASTEIVVGPLDTPTQLGASFPPLSWEDHANGTGVPAFTSGSTLYTLHYSTPTEPHWVGVQAATPDALTVDATPIDPMVSSDLTRPDIVRYDADLDQLILSMPGSPRRIARLDGDGNVVSSLPMPDIPMPCASVLLDPHLGNGLTRDTTLQCVELVIDDDSECGAPSPGWQPTFDVVRHYFSEAASSWRTETLGSVTGDPSTCTPVVGFGIVQSVADTTVAMVAETGADGAVDLVVFVGSSRHVIVDSAPSDPSPIIGAFTPDDTGEIVLAGYSRTENLMDFDARAALVDVANNSVIARDLTIFPLQTNREGTIAASHFDGEKFFFALRVDDPAGTPTDLLGRFIHPDGSLEPTDAPLTLSPPLSLEASATGGQRNYHPFIAHGVFEQSLDVIDDTGAVVAREQLDSSSLDGVRGSAVFEKNLFRWIYYDQANRIGFINGECATGN